MIKYVPHSSDLAFPAPIVCEGTRLYCFLLEGDRTCLETFTHDIFETPSHGAVRYQPLSHHVLLTIGQTNKLYSGSDKRGHAVEANVVIWILAAAVKKVGPVQFAERIVLIPAYTIVHELYSLVGGHETYGFFKGFGKVHLKLDGEPERLMGQNPEDLPPFDVAPQFLTVHVVGLKEFGLNNRIQPYPLLGVSRCGDVSKGTERMPWTSPREIFHDLKSIMFGEGGITLPGFELPLNLVIDAVEQECPLAFLKQFRDARSDDGAAYQAIIEAPAHIQRIEGVRLLDDYQFSFETLANYKLKRDLGLTDQKAISNFVVDLDFIVRDGKEIWNARSLL